MKKKAVTTPMKAAKVPTTPMKATKATAMKAKAPMKAMKASKASASPEKAKYSIMYYKRDANIGIRQRFGEGKQIMSLGGRLSKVSEKTLRDIGRSVIRKLQDGDSVAECKVFGMALVDDAKGQ